jgi:hypothetical protein
MDLEKVYSTFYAIGTKISQIESSKDKKILKKIIVDLRNEEIPEKFIETLVKDISNLCLTKGAHISIPEEIIKKKLKGNKFYALKSTIIAALLNVYVRGESYESNSN